MDFNHFFAEEEIRYFKNFRDYIFTSLKKHEEEMQAAASEYEKVKPENSEYSESVEITYQNVIFEKEQTQQLMIQSFLISIFSFIEDETNCLCDEIGQSRKLTFTFRDMKGTGIDRSILFLKKICDIDFPTEQSLREKFLHYRGFRNIATHANGFFGDKDIKKQYESASKKYKDYKINIIGEVTFSKVFVDNLISFTEAIISSIFLIREEIVKAE